jgi:very-short-patch-repair endonuclease
VHGSSSGNGPEARILGAPGLPSDLTQLSEAADEQLGLVTRAQCRSAGLTDSGIQWRVERGRWVRIHPGVYLTVPGRDDWWMRALAALLAVDDAAWSHRTAAFVHGLLSTPPQAVDLLVGHERRLHPPPDVLLHRRRDVNRCVDELHWPWRTTVEETILDVSSSASVDETFALLGRAFHRRLTTESALRGRLSLRERHPRRALLAMVLGDVADGAESAMEVRYVRDVERAHGLPQGQRQLSIRPDGSAVHDIGYVDQRVLVELDGRLGHEGPEARVKDGVRERHSATTGWLTIRAFWRDVAGFPCDLALDAGAVLNSRGWTGRVRPCRRRLCSVA